MQIYNGKSVFGGIAIGKISVYQKKEQQVKRVKIDDPEQEMARYEKAKAEGIKQLQGLYDKALREVGEANAAIFEVHQMMMEDDGYNESVENIIRSQGVNAEYAVATTGDNYAQMFSAMDDDYMRERAADVRDISERLLTILNGEETGAVDADEPKIIVAEDLAPSETVQLDKDKVLSFVTVKGSLNSHTAILARTMAIPALVNASVPLESEIDGRLGIVDGANGTFYVDPDEETLAEMKKRQEEDLSRKQLLLTLKGKENVTLDGQKVMLYANIGNIKDLATVIQNDAGGIGLFRSEFIYLEKEDFPTEEEQFQIYRQVAQTMAGKRVIIRTLDIGGDKHCDCLSLEEEDNPFLGFRAIRICLQQKDMFKVQLRSILRAGLYGKLAIMIPMVTMLSEILETKQLIEEVKEEMRKENIPFAEDVPVGIMVETPASAVMAPLFAKHVDFFSIGTNDLVQYTLAVDRGNQSVSYLYDYFNPAVIHSIHRVITAAHEAGIWAGMCGEMAGDKLALPFLLALGIDELSMSASQAPVVKEQIRNLESGICDVDKILSLTTTEEVREYLQSLL